jgi:hypothetical protein
MFDKNYFLNKKLTKELEKELCDYCNRRTLYKLHINCIDEEGHFDDEIEEFVVVYYNNDKIIKDVTIFEAEAELFD